MKNIFHHLVICNPYEGHQLTSCRSFVAEEDQDIYDDVESTLRGDLGNLNYFLVRLLNRSFSHTRSAAMQKEFFT